MKIRRQRKRDIPRILALLGTGITDTCRDPTGYF